MNETMKKFKKYSIIICVIAGLAGLAAFNNKNPLLTAKIRF